MIFANYHTHTTFCDGRDTPEQLVQEALRLGCPAIGFSGHSIAPYDYAGMTPEHEAQYRAEVRRLQAACAGQIRILCGVEQDYWFGGDWYAMAEEYYRLVGNLYEKTRCRVIAHFDLIEKFNEDGSLFDRNAPRYRAAALCALEQLRSAPVIFEINTGAIARGYRSTPYPAPFLLQAMQHSHLPRMLAADCHDRRFLLQSFAQYASLVTPGSFEPEFLLDF